VLGGGLLLRLWLAFAVFPGRGFQPDIDGFHRWSVTLATSGPGSFYSLQPGADYPPGYLYVLWALGGLRVTAAALLGVTPARALDLLLKVPPILADLGVAALAARVAARRLGPWAGVLAPAVYLFVPVTWYDSAMWGQVDGVAALVMMAALVLLLEGWSEAAATVALVAVLVKPQALICLLVVAVVLLRRHLLAVGSGPMPPLGGRSARLGPLLWRQGPIRLASSAGLAVTTAAALLLPFDFGRYASGPLAGVPVVRGFAGLWGLLSHTASEYPILTANAFNAWALVGPHPLVTAVGRAHSWTPDSLPVLGGMPAGVVGAALLGAAALAVAAGLLLRDGWLTIVLGFTVMAFAFYALPTKVHERYLFAIFAPGAILAAGTAVRLAGYAAAGLLNAINLHAVLSGYLALPLGDAARRPEAATAVSLAQTTEMLVLLAIWGVLVARSDGVRLAIARFPREPRTALVLGAGWLGLALAVAGLGAAALFVFPHGLHYWRALGSLAAAAGGVSLYWMSYRWSARPAAAAPAAGAD